MSNPKNPWEQYPELAHLSGEQRQKLEERVRLRKIRYMLYRLRTQTEKKEPLEAVEGLLPGFIAFWLGEKPVYQVGPKGEKTAVPPNKMRTVFELGAYGTFAAMWDVDEELNVYLRHSSVWQEWNNTLQRIVPILGE